MRKKSESLTEILNKERAKLDRLTEKRKNIDAEIKTTKDNIARYEQMANAEQYNTLSNALDAQGISMEDILAAVKSGDFLSLQDKLETADGDGEDTTAGEA